MLLLNLILLIEVIFSTPTPRLHSKCPEQGFLSVMALFDNRSESPFNFFAVDAHARRIGSGDGGANMSYLLRKLWDDEGQDIAEYAVMLAVILVLVVGTIRLVGSNANNAFSSVASSLQ